MQNTLAPLLHPANPHPKYRPDIDGLRAVAILSVVGYHTFPNLISGGFIGVDIFFVISGFLISDIIFSSLERGHFNFSDFYFHRVRRIFPALVTVLLATVAIGYLTLLPDELRILGKHIVKGGGFLENLLLKKEEGYFDIAGELKPLMHLWSLAIEEQFYLIYPVLVFILWKVPSKRFALLFIIFAISFSLNILGIKAEPVATFFLPQTRFWELLAGGLLAWPLSIVRAGKLEQQNASRWAVFFRETSSTPFREGMAYAGLIFIGTSIFLFNRLLQYPGWYALLPVVGCSLSIAAGPNTFVNKKILGNTYLVFIGLISYPLYLWHWPLLSFAYIINAGPLSPEIRAGMVAMAFALAWLTYHVIEKPIRRRQGHPALIPSLVICLLAAIGTGALVESRKGYPGRSESLTRIDEQLRWGVKEVSSDCRKQHPEIKDGFCVQTPNSTANIILIGDSHAHHLFPGLMRLLANSGTSVLLQGKEGCIPFYDTEAINEKGNIRSCKETINAALDTAISDKQSKILIMSFRGTSYLSGDGFATEEQGKYLQLISPTRRASDTNQIVFRDSMRRTMSKLVTSGKRIIFVIDIPELGFDPKRCFDIEAPALSRRAQQSPCRIPRQEFDLRSSKYQETVRSVLREFPTVEIFETTPYFCDEIFCYGMRDGVSWYRDDDHLSLAGSEKIANSMIKILQLSEKKEFSPSTE